MITRRSPRIAIALYALTGAPLALGLLATTVARAETPAPTAQMGPQELMDSVARRMFEALDANRAAIKKDPEKVFPLVDSILLPNFDTEEASRLVLGQTWNTATADQRKRFVSALYHALLRLYGGAISDFTADRMKILPFRGDPAAKVATVRTLVTRSSGAVVPVDYRRRNTATGWKAFDVVIEGISYVRNYRTDLGAEVSQKGLEAVITRLEKEGLATSDPKGGGKTAEAR